MQFENFQNIMTLKFIKFLFIMYSTKSLHPFVSIATSVLQSITPIYTFVIDQSETLYFVEYTINEVKAIFFFLVIITFGS